MKTLKCVGYSTIYRALVDLVDFFKLTLLVFTLSLTDEVSLEVTV
jgi:hypothetical protein